jgi:hypothetical protein
MWPAYALTTLGNEREDKGKKRKEEEEEEEEERVHSASN